jgi:hypothetical protein
MGLNFGLGLWRLHIIFIFYYWLFPTHLFGLSTVFGHSIPRPLDLDGHSVKRPLKVYLGCLCCHNTLARNGHCLAFLLFVMYYSLFFYGDRNVQKNLILGCDESYDKAFLRQLLLGTKMHQGNLLVLHGPNIERSLHGPLH